MPSNGIFSLPSFKPVRARANTHTHAHTLAIGFPGDLRPYILTKRTAEESIVVVVVVGGDGGGGGGVKPSLPPITINPALYSPLIVFRASTLEVRLNL